jgi:acetyl-CoA carboxylase biotin carboxyl carrier protein
MAFTMDDVLEVLKIMKECDDAELHIETGDLKLSIAKGDVVSSSTTSIGFSTESTVSRGVQVEAVPTAIPALEEKGSENAATPEATAVPAGAQAGEVAIPEGLVPIRATVTSVFYRKPNPDEPPFVDIGSEIDEDTIVCLLDVMKCYHSVPAGVRGRIENILVESGDLVESGAVMFLVNPA